MPVSFFTAVLDNFIPRLIRVTYKIKYCECEKIILNVEVEYEKYLVHNINDVKGFTWRVLAHSDIETSNWP